MRTGGDRTTLDRRFLLPEEHLEDPQPAASIEAGVIDLFVIRIAPDGWRVLALERAPDVRCPGAWEVVHGSIQGGESPEDAAVRELREETGLSPERLYSVTVNPFYVAKTRTVQLAVVFAAFVPVAGEVMLGEEHTAHRWLTVDEAAEQLFWPAERRTLRTIAEMFPDGHAGRAEDVLRVR
jgi:dATP pyrophosphohydrolase